MVKETVLFALISDCHLHLHGTNGWVMAGSSVEIFRSVMQSVARLRPDFVLLPGDLLHDGERENLVEILLQLKQLSCPYFVVAGNHDFKQEEWLNSENSKKYISENEFIAAFNGHGYAPKNKSYYSVHLPGGMRLIGLDGCHRRLVEGWGGSLSDEQLSWLDGELAAADEDVIVMIHHGLVHYGQDHESQLGRWYSLDNKDTVRSIINRQRGKVRLVVSGHRHIGLRYEIVEGIPYFSIPSIVSYPMRYALFSMNSEFFDFQSFEVDDDGELRRQARNYLVASDHFLSGGTGDIVADLSFYENPRQYSGRIKRG